MDERKQEGELHLLGGSTVYKQDYAPEVLEAFTNKHQGNDYWVRFNCPEFTSLCPITGQPDFATITISYVPGERMVESKSLKLYLFSFRNHGDFHEDCVNVIMKDLIKLMDPKYIEVWGKLLFVLCIKPSDIFVDDIFVFDVTPQRHCIAGKMCITGCLILPAISQI